MLGFEGLRKNIVAALNAKVIEIMTPHAAKEPDQIPKNDLARATVLRDLAEIFAKVSG